MENTKKESALVSSLINTCGAIQIPFAFGIGVTIGSTLGSLFSATGLILCEDPKDILREGIFGGLKENFYQNHPKMYKAIDNSYLTGRTAGQFAIFGGFIYGAFFTR